MRKQNQIDWLRRARRTMSSSTSRSSCAGRHVPPSSSSGRCSGSSRRAPPPLARSRWVQRDGTQIHLLFTDEPVVPQGGHVAVVAEDFDATFAALRDAGFAPEEHAPAVGRGARVRAHPRGPPRRVHG